MVRIISLILSFLIILPAAYAEDKPAHRHGSGHFSELKDKLNLTDEQREQFKKLREGSDKWSKMKTLFQEKDKLHELIKSQDTAESEILAQLEKVNKLQTESNTARVKSILEMKKILTPQQFAIMSEHFEKKRESFRNGMRERFQGKHAKNGDKQPEKE